MRTKEQYEELIERANKRISYLFMLAHSTYQGPYSKVIDNIDNVLVSLGVNISDYSDVSETTRKFNIFRDKTYNSIYRSYKKINTYKQRIKNLK